MDTLTKAVKEAIEKAPGTTRALAEEAGVAHTTLARIISGERSASVDTARRIIEVLTAWSRRCDHGVTRIQRVIQTVEETK